MGPGHWRSAWRCWARRSSRLARLRRRCCAWPACTQKRSRCWRWICTIWWPAAVWRGFGGGRAGAWADQPDALCRPDWACATGAGSGGHDIAPGLGGRAGGGGMRGPRTRPSRCPAHRHTGPNCCQRRATPAGGGAVGGPSAPYCAVGAGARAAGHYGGAGGHGAGLGLGGQRAAAGGFMRRTPPQPCRGVFSFAARRAIRLTCAVAVLNPARTKGWVQ